MSGKPLKAKAANAPSDGGFLEADDLAPERGGEGAMTGPFSEREFQETFDELMKANKPDAATRHLLRSLARLEASRINPQEKIAHLHYMTHKLQAVGSTKHGYAKLLKKVKGPERWFAKHPPPPGGAFVDLGCGAHDPLALATYYYLNGFEPAVAVDLLPARNAEYSAYAMYDLLANVRLFPGRWVRKGGSIPAMVERSRKFEPRAFEAGDFEGGFAKLNGMVRFESKDLVDLAIEPGTVSLLVSFAVLEHVSDLEGVLAAIKRLLRPGGIAFHFVDLADHRAYRGDKEYGPFTFLTEEEGPKNLNRLRAVEIHAAHVAAGFEILEEERNAEKMPEAIRARLVGKWKTMPIEDVSVTKHSILVRKPY